MQCHEGRFRCVDRLEALAGAESRDGQQPVLVSGVPEIPLSAPPGFEQRHLHHVDHALSPNVRRYITFSLFDSITLAPVRFSDGLTGKSKPIDLVKNPNLVNAAILAVYADIWPAVYINEQMPIPLLLDCAKHHLISGPNIELMGAQLVLRWQPMLRVRLNEMLGTPLTKEINVCYIEKLLGRNAEQSHEALRLQDARRRIFALAENDF